MAKKMNLSFLCRKERECLSIYREVLFENKCRVRLLSEAMEMIKESALRKFALVFGILCTVGFVVCLAFAVTLPRSDVYNTVFGTVRATRSGSFDISFLSPIIILGMGAYVGFSMFACIRSDKKATKKTENKKTEEQGDINILSEPAKDESGV